MMTWTSHSEADIRCKNPPGPVRAGELVARLLHTRNSDPHQDTFLSKDFFPPRGGAISNVCGASSGFSVDRCDQLSDDDLRARAKAFAASRNNGRVSKGAIVASVDDLRGIRVTGSPDEQVVFVYDDPKYDDPKDPNEEHAVVRVRASVDRTDWDDLRDKIRKAFRRSVSP